MGAGQLLHDHGSSCPEFPDNDVYKRYAYDVTLADGHAAATRSSVSVITDFDSQKSIFSDDELGSICVPVLAIWGEHDPLFQIGRGYRLA